LINKINSQIKNSTLHLNYFLRVYTLTEASDWQRSERFAWCLSLHTFLAEALV